MYFLRGSCQDVKTFLRQKVNDIDSQKELKLKTKIGKKLNRI